jgi:hypothetical protein
MRDSYNLVKKEVFLDFFVLVNIRNLGANLD